jgi:ABC-type branched-subunit amino acid transport system ATPase component
MMLLDEPMAGMGHEDIDKVAALIKRISQKYTILMVEHNLNVVANLSDTITVLTRGKVLAEGITPRSRSIRRSRKPIWELAMSNQAGNNASSPVLNVKNLEAWYGESHILHGMNFDVRQGEVVTLLGRNGAGKTSTLKSVMGLIGKRPARYRSRVRN